MIHEHDSFYDTAAWKEKRAHILRRDKYTDQLELRAGRHVPATLVHHILPRSKYPEYSLADWNLISISGDTHRDLHTIYGELSRAGEELMRRTAHENGVKLSVLTLVVGLPGTGKTTLVRERLKSGGGLAYNLDYIANAFLLNKPNGEVTAAARRLVNTMVIPFAVNARRYTGRVYVIRTAPDIGEVEYIEPDEIIVCRRCYAPGKQKGLDRQELITRLEDLEGWAEANGVPVSAKE